MKSVFLAATLLSSTVFAGSANIDFDLMHTRLGCNYVGYQPSFCDMMNDTKTMDERSGMIDKINAQLDRALISPSTSKVYIAYLSFSNKGIHRKLCELLKKDVSVRIVLDRGSAGSPGVPGNVDTLKSNKACEGVDVSSPASKLKVSYLGGLTGSPWRLHHNKFLYVNPGNGDRVNINYSSGNLSSFGTSLHADHWVTALAPQDSNLIKSYECVMEGLEKATANGMIHTAANDSQVAKTYIDARERCFKEKGTLSVRDALAQEGIAPLFSPNTDDIVLKTLTSEINSASNNGYIYIAVQHFLNPSIGNALANASNNRRVDVRIIMDDDVVTNKGEVQGAMEYLNRLKKQAPKIKVRYIETNHLAGGNGQMMHNKFAILNGKRVLSGAGQYTTAAMKNNWENFGLTEVPQLTRKYEEYFKDLWDISVDEGYVRAQLEKGETFQELTSAELLNLGLPQLEGKVLGSPLKQAERTAPEAYHPNFLK